VSDEEKDWSSVLEAIERDITSLNNEYRFKKLIAKLQDEKREVKLEEIYKSGWDAKGPWNLICEKIRTDLEDTGFMKDKIE